MVAAMCQLEGDHPALRLWGPSRASECPFCYPPQEPHPGFPLLNQSSINGGKQRKAAQEPEKLPAARPTVPTHLLTLKRGKLMLFLMKRVKFSASRRRAGLGETALTHRPSPGVLHTPRAGEGRHPQPDTGGEGVSGKGRGVVFGLSRVRTGSQES